jgi:glycosyltransferase involved in cell wall biosynthesis
MSEQVDKQVDDVDVLLVGLGSTEGLRRADDELARSLRCAGARVAIASAHRPGDVRTMMLTDLRWAAAARRAAGHKLAQLKPRSVLYSTTTAALLWSRPGAIRFDAPAAANRPGRHGLWQRPLERRRLGQAPLLLPWSEGGLAEASAAIPHCAERALVVPAPVTPFDTGRESDRRRDIDALTYAGNPRKKGFDRVLEAWRRVRRPSERLVVVGITDSELQAAGFDIPDESVQIAGSLPQHEYRALLRRARAFVCAPRREDYGLAQLEALAEGCQLVTIPAPGPYVALPIAHRLDHRLVGDDLGSALRAALDTPSEGYAERAAQLMEPFSAAAADRLVADELLPRLLGE